MRRVLLFVAAFIALSVGSMGIATAGGGCHPPAGTTEGKGVEVKVANCSFSPTIIHAPLGAKVTWYNGDYLSHAINGLGWDATEPFAPTNPGTTVSHAFSVEGIYPYMCYVHPGMAGVVVVGDAALNPNADGAMTTPVVTDLSGLMPAPAPAPAASVAAASTTGVEPATTIVLVLAAALSGYAFASLRRYRWSNGASRIQRRHGVHAR
jgi:plastocyanin